MSEKWTADDTAHRPGGLPQPDLAKVGEVGVWGEDLRARLAQPNRKDCCLIECCSIQVEGEERMDMQELANRMDASVQAMLAAQSRDMTEATLIRTAASLLDKLNDRDLQIRTLRLQVDVMAKELSELRQQFTDDGK